MSPPLETRGRSFHGLTLPTAAKRRFSGPALGLCLVFGLSGCGEPPATPAAGAEGTQRSALLVETAEARPQVLRETLSATGTLLPVEAVTLQAETSGIVTEILFDEGKAVRKGDVLLKLDDSELRAELARAEARLKLAETLERRQRDLFQAKAISEAEIDETRANVATARADVDVVRAQIAKRQILAPFDGVVGLRRISPGAYLTPGTSIGSFQDTRSLKIDFSVPERYASFLKVGQVVRFRLAGRSEPVEARISAIEPTVDIQTRTLGVRATLPNPEQKLTAGGFAEVEVPLTEAQDAILIPAIALIPGLRQPTVFVHRDGRAEERKVQAGIRTADSVQIVEGIQPGDQVITTGVLQLRPGMSVRVRPPASAETPAPVSRPETPSKQS